MDDQQVKGITVCSNLVRGLCVILAWAALPCAVFSAEVVESTNSIAKPAFFSVSYIIQTVSGLLLVLLVFWAFSSILRRVNTGRVDASAALRVVGGLGIGPREKLVIVQAGDKYLLLGVSNGHIQKIDDIDYSAADLQRHEKPRAGSALIGSVKSAIIGRSMS